MNAAYQLIVNNAVKMFNRYMGLPIIPKQDMSTWKKITKPSFAPRVLPNLVEYSNKVKTQTYETWIITVNKKHNSEQYHVGFYLRGDPRPISYSAEVGDKPSIDMLRGTIKAPMRQWLHDRHRTNKRMGGDIDVLDI